MATVRLSREGRTVAIAVISTLVFGALVVFGITQAPGWPAFKAYFFDWGIYRDSFPDIARAFWVNVKLFVLAEIFILPAALLLAVLRSLPGPVFFPIRAIAVIYADLFRGIPTILVVLMLGFGMPALGVSGVPISPFFWAVVALVLVYTAYVSEVYRSGIESVHPSQEAAARSLGLSRTAALRYVVLPQAVRRVIPPLLNDFIGLQKDTALVNVIGAMDAFNQAKIIEANHFNLSPVTTVGILFVVFTVPQTRFVDRLLEREQRRTQAGG
jgi:polar amino acid transport system permease protein